MKTFFQTDDAWSGLILRVVLGTVMFAHGAQKLLGWYGGNGFDATMGFFTGSMGIPWILAFLVVLGESFGALALIAGFLTRLAAFGIASIMVGAIGMVHWQHGFFMNWFGNGESGEGFEYHLLALGMSLSLLITGPGKWSLDGVISNQIKE